MNDKWVFESAMSRLERANFRAWVLCILVLIMLLATNITWIVYELNWQVVDCTTETVEQGAEIGGDGDITLNNGGDINGE